MTDAPKRKGKIVELSGKIRARSRAMFNTGKQPDDDGTSARAFEISNFFKQGSERLYRASVTLGQAASEWYATGNDRLSSELARSLDKGEPKQ
jgi:hypothetical protein